MVVMLFVGVLLGDGVIAYAQQPTIAAPEQQGFVPVKDLPTQQEQLPAAPLVMTAYAVAWVVVVLYLWSIWRRLGAVEREIAAVSRRLDPGARG
jgi:CcmD family protein